MSSFEKDGGSVELAVKPTYLGPDQENGDHLSPTSRRASSVYETKYQKSLRHYLTEALPNENYYRNSIDGFVRPTLEDLINPSAPPPQIQFHKVRGISSGTRVVMAPNRYILLTFPVRIAANWFGKFIDLVFLSTWPC